MASSSKKRQTMAKMTRERTVKERRALKQEKKAAAAAAKHAEAADGTLATDTGDDELGQRSEPLAEAESNPNSGSS